MDRLPLTMAALGGHPLCGKETGGIDDEPGGDVFAVHIDDEVRALGFDGRHRPTDKEVETVVHSVVDQGETRLVGIDDGGGGAVQGCERFPRDVGLFAVDTIRTPQLQAGDPAFVADDLDLLERLELGLVEGDGQVAVLEETEAQLGGELLPHLIASPHEVALDRVGRSVVTGVDDAAVRLRGPEPDFDLAFDQGDIDPVAGEPSRHGAPDDATANDHNVLHHSTVSLTHLGTRWRKSVSEYPLDPPPNLSKSDGPDRRRGKDGALRAVAGTDEPAAADGPERRDQS